MGAKRLQGATPDACQCPSPRLPADLSADRCGWYLMFCSLTSCSSACCLHVWVWPWQYSNLEFIYRDGFLYCMATKNKFSYSPKNNLCYIASSHLQSLFWRSRFCDNAVCYRPELLSSNRDDIVLLPCCFCFCSSRKIYHEAICDSCYWSGWLFCRSIVGTTWLPKQHILNSAHNRIGFWHWPNSRNIDWSKCRTW